jgi:hypothetical protein
VKPRECDEVKETPHSAARDHERDDDERRSSSYSEMHGSLRSPQLSQGERVRASEVLLPRYNCQKI